jgi:hypothetical protein
MTRAFPTDNHNDCDDGRVLQETDTFCASTVLRKGTESLYSTVPREGGNADGLTVLRSTAMTGKPTPVL